MVLAQGTRNFWSWPRSETVGISRVNGTSTNSYLCSSFLQCGPLELVQHFCDATCCPVISHDKVGRSALDHLQFPNVVNGIRVPDNSGVLCYMSHKCLVAQLLIVCLGH